MNKKHDHELIIDLYFNKKKSYYYISKLLNMNKSSVGYIIQKYKEGDEFLKKESIRRRNNRRYKADAEEYKKLYEDVKIKLKNSENQLNDLKTQKSKNDTFILPIGNNIANK